MSASALALLGYAAWALLLLTVIVLMRSYLALTGKHPSYSFKPDGSDVSEFSVRLCRAHANCYENLPMFAAIILVAMVTGNEAVTDPLARWVLVARVAQSIVHLISTSNMAITVRLTFLTVQLVIEIYWIIQLSLIALGG